MDYVLAALVGCFVTVGIYLLLSRSVIRMLLGLVVFGNGVNLLIFTAGRLTRAVAPIVPQGLAQPDGPPTYRSCPGSPSGSAPGKHPRRRSRPSRHRS